MTGAAGPASLSMQGVDQFLAAQIASFLALLLAASAGHKWLRFAHIRGVAREFAGLPDAAAAAAVVAAGAAEWLAAVLLILPAYRAPGSLLAASLLTVYLALIARSLMAGRRNVDCGCSFGAARHTLGAFEVGRNASLAVFALFVAASSVSGGSVITPSQGLAAAALLALYAALDQVMGLQPMRKGAVL